jgi:FKBP-type peptidyl-prolyl cis-trans isomerase (trigger factor)
MQVVVSDVSPILKQLSVTVPAELLQDEFNKQVAVYAKTAVMKGFRVGKVPLAQVKQYFHDKIFAKAMSVLIKKTLSDAIKQENLRPVSVPSISSEQINPDLSYVATFEVMPVVTNITFTPEASIVKLLVDISDDELNETIASLKNKDNHAQIDDLAFAKNLGHDSVEDLREDIRLMLSASGQRLARKKFNDSVVSLLVAQNPLQLPDALIAEEMRKIHSKVCNKKQQHAHNNAYYNFCREQACYNLTAWFLLSFLIKQHGLKVEQDQIHERLASMAIFFDNKEEFIASAATNDKILHEVKGQILDDLIVAQLLTDVAVTEKTVSYKECLLMTQNTNT